MSLIVIRPFQLGDEQGIMEAHVASIQKIASRDYTPEQIEAWSGNRNVNMYLEARETGEQYWVIDDNGRIGGFAGWVPGRIRGFYMHPDYAERGLGRKLFEAAEHDMLTRSEVTICEIDGTLTAKPFYQRMGFSVVEETMYKFPSGVEVPIVKMVKHYQRQQEQDK